MTPFEKATQNFIQHLSRDGRSTHTLKNYASDLESLSRFLREQSLTLNQLGLPQLQAYHEDLCHRGLKPNSRRRKIMTAKSFLRHLHGGKRLFSTEKLIPLDRVENPPKLINLETLKKIIADQDETAVGLRNRALLLTLWQTGALVTEVLDLRKIDLKEIPKTSELEIHFLGNRERRVRVGEECARALLNLKRELPKNKNYLFYGYHRAKPHDTRVTPRAIELQFRVWSKRYSEPQLRPRILRHAYIMDRFRAGASEKEIMDELGLRTAYVFALYKPLLKLEADIRGN